MLEALEPTKDPAWTISHEGYNVLTESAVESRLAFGNGRYGDDLPEVAGWSWGARSTIRWSNRGRQRLTLKRGGVNVFAIRLNQLRRDAGAD